MGGRPCFLAVLLISAVLFLSLSQGMGRNIKIIRFEEGAYGKLLHEEDIAKGREMVEFGGFAMDYTEPGANTNPRSGALFNSPPPGPKH